MYLLGIDIGSSSIKVAIVDAASKKQIGVEQHPSREMDMIAIHTGWAEQHPTDWWTNLCIATNNLIARTSIDTHQIKSIGISYQMHGLVLVDKDHAVIRPSIIWCDSRAVDIGNKAFEEIGPEKCLSELMNSPGNFTASKLRWVKENEPENYSKIYKIMLPGDYIAMKLTGQINTTVSGLSEGMLWDYQNNEVSQTILNYYEIDEKIIPNIVAAFAVQGEVTNSAAAEIGLVEGIPVGYRAGDQPNNAISLGVLNPGEVAATGGTSGVVYGVIDQSNYDSLSRVNNFAHVNHNKDLNRIGVLLCINGSGIAYSFIKQMMASVEENYPELESMAQKIPVGSNGLLHLPFGNGAERMLNNKNVGSHFAHVEFNRHQKAHFYRATLEGIAFSFVYGIEIMKSMGLKIDKIRAGNDNLFQSEIFSNTIATLTKGEINIVNTTGAIGAAKASGVAAGIYRSIEQACEPGEIIKVFKPSEDDMEYTKAYKSWRTILMTHLG